MAMVKVLLGCSTVQKYKRKNINLGNGRCVSVSQSGDKSEMINLFELRKVAGRLVAWAEQLDFIRCYFYRTRVRSLFTLVSDSLTHSLTH